MMLAILLLVREQPKAFRQEKSKNNCTLTRFSILLTPFSFQGVSVTVRKTDERNLYSESAVHKLIESQILSCS